jgi:hypothetical protein
MPDAAPGVLPVAVSGGGVGGVGFIRGTGLVGLKNRLEALGGWLLLDSPRSGDQPVRSCHLPARMAASPLARMRTCTCGLIYLLVKNYIIGAGSRHSAWLIADLL